MIESIRSIKEGNFTWEETGLLDGLDKELKPSLIKLYNEAADILLSTDEPMSVLLPCIRRIYTGIYSFYLKRLQLHRFEYIYKELDIKDVSIRAAELFTNVSEINTILLTKYDVLVEAMKKTTTTTDCEAESTALYRFTSGKPLFNVYIFYTDSFNDHFVNIQIYSISY